MTPDEIQLATRLDAELPQTQCAQCGYPACRPYAEAMARGEADINQCPPGGDAAIRRLASLLQRPCKPLNPANGVERSREIAVIEERLCIGCTLCIQACPVDAIAGGPRSMHTVVSDLCTGCGLCLPPCPVDCIAMEPCPPTDLWDRDKASAARDRFEQRQRRLQQEPEQKLKKMIVSTAPGLAQRARVIQAALGRARALRAARQGSK